MRSHSRPGPRAGEISKRTLSLRDKQTLTAPQIRKARKLRKAGMEMTTIAELMKVPVIGVSQALGGMRTPRVDPPRAMLNVSIAAKERVYALRRPKEAIWQTMNRILGIPTLAVLFVLAGSLTF